MYRHIGLPTMLLWPAAALALIALLGSLILILPHDFWWHMKIGEVISQEHHIPDIDTYSFTQNGAPMVYQSWLSELIFYELYRLGGLSLIVIARNLLLVVTYALLAWQSYQRSASWRLAAVGILAAACVAFNNWTVRPQIFSWLPFVLCWTILAGYTGGWLRARWLLVLPPVELLWANLHGAFMLGLALVAVVASGETLSAAGRIWRPEHQHAEALDPGLRHVALLWLTFVGMVVATLVNPLGFGLYQYVYTLLTDPSSQQLVVEWQAPDPSKPLSFLFFATAILILLLWLRAPAFGRLSDLLVLLAFTWLALSGIRYLLWYGLISGPLLAQLLARGRPPARRPGHGSAAQQLFNLVLVALLFLPALMVQPPFRHAVPLPAVFGGNPAPHPEANLVTADTPLRAVAYLREHYLGKRLYHEMSYGSYLIWAFGGRIPVFTDPRVELYPLSLWLDYRRISRGCDYTALLEKYQIDALLLDRQRQSQLLAQLQDDPAWEQVYEDSHSLIYRRSVLATTAGPNLDATVSRGARTSASAVGCEMEHRP